MFLIFVRLQKVWIRGGGAALNLTLLEITYCFQNTFLRIYILNHMHLHSKYKLL
jgi:hypothetical protein